MIAEKTGESPETIDTIWKVYDTLFIEVRLLKISSQLCDENKADNYFAWLLQGVICLVLYANLGLVDIFGIAKIYM